MDACPARKGILYITEVLDGVCSNSVSALGERRFVMF